MKIDKTQQNCKFRLYGDGDETIKRIISECSKLAQQEYKTGHDGLSKVIHREMCKKFKFDHTNKWYMHNPASVLENDTKNPMGLLHTDGLLNLGQKTRPNNNQQKKRIFQIVDFAVSADHRIKLKECEKKEKYFDHTRELKKLWNMVTIVPIVIGACVTVTK